MDSSMRRHNPALGNKQQLAWNAIADHWEQKQNEGGVDGNDMFRRLLLPTVEKLANLQPGQNVLDLGTGTGIVSRRLAREGAKVTGHDFSSSMIGTARQQAEKDDIAVEYGYINLMDVNGMITCRSKLDTITISTTLKSLPSLEPIAEALPLLLKEDGW
ncbi:hypothetical protein LTR49_027964 [Elasticomyces elasticus]|nr:hypothetical protein LTR49_027964 [Elasticomyces elasticus]